MPSRAIEQAWAERIGDSFRVVAQSAGCRDAWTSEIERLARGIGTPPEGLTVDDALYVQPLGKTHIAVITYRGDWARLQFRFLLVDRALFTRFVGDPFLIADRFPAAWEPRSPLESLEWPEEPPPARTVAKLQHVLQTGDSPTLLGGVQALIDGGRLIFERSAPATQLVRDLWQLLPYGSQAELWPATFVFSTSLDLHLCAVPSIAGVKLDRFLTEEQALDYPHGRYELALQYAVEHGDEREMQRLLRRRTGRQTLRLAIFILIGAILLAVIMGLLQPK